MEKSLGQIAEDTFEKSVKNVCDPDLWEETAKAVEKEVLSRLKKSEVEPVAGQELTFVQAAQWIEKHGSPKGLQWLDSSGKWRDDYVTVLYVDGVYRVAPKKVNDPDDPNTWEKGVAIFVRKYEHEPWVLDRFMDNTKEFGWKFSGLNTGIWKQAKLATPEQIEAWKLINDDV